MKAAAWVVLLLIVSGEAHSLRGNVEVMGSLARLSASAHDHNPAPRWNTVLKDLITRYAKHHSHEASALDAQLGVQSLLATQSPIKSELIDVRSVDYAVAIAAGVMIVVLLSLLVWLRRQAKAEDVLDPPIKSPWEDPPPVPKPQDTPKDPPKPADTDTDTDTEPDHGDDTDTDSPLSNTGSRPSPCGSKNILDHLPASAEGLRVAKPNVMEGVHLRAKPTSLEGGRTRWSDGSLNPKHLIPSDSPSSDIHLQPVPIEPRPWHIAVPKPKIGTKSLPRTYRFDNEQCDRKAPPMPRFTSTKKCDSRNPFCQESGLMGTVCRHNLCVPRHYAFDSYVFHVPQDDGSIGKQLDWVQAPMQAPQWAARAETQPKPN